jgi:signal transduction histidine kinase
VKEGSGILDQPTVLIISDDPEFSRAVMTRWQSERTLPSFTAMSTEVSLNFDPESFHLAIAGAIRPQALSVVLEAIEASGKRVLFVAEDPCTLQTVNSRWPAVLVLQKKDQNWLDVLILLAREALQRANAEARASRAEQANAKLQTQATLGRYMLEMRHGLNNALTSVLGNSELLLLEPGTLSSGVRSQIETIRHMSLRMHEILQRFSSLEKELKVVNLHAAKEDKLHSTAAGW